MTENASEMTRDQALSVLDSLFPAGPTGSDVVEDLREEGWHGSSADLARAVGEGLWSVFSDNHDVLAPDGRIVSLGSWRGSGGEIAEFLNARVSGCSFDYLDFYMAGQFESGGENGIGAIQRMLFRRLRARGFDWRYSFPRIYIVRFPRREPVDDPADPAWKGYSPDEALRREAEEDRRRAEEAETDEHLARLNREAVERARRLPPPGVVRAYRAAYDRDPAGWPPSESDE